MAKPPRIPPPDGRPAFSPESAPAGWVESPVRRVRGGLASDETDRLALEVPLEIRIGSQPFTVLMRTPGNDEELVAGFLWSEGLVQEAGAILSLGHPESLLEGDCQNVVAVELDAGLGGAPVVGRNFYASASCGVCGKNSIADLVIRSPRIVSDFRIERTLLESLPDRLQELQPVFAATGGLHGAALFDAAGELLAAREDIGRHNAVDKLIGWAFAERRLPLSDAVLVVSGRLGFEIVQKAIVAGIPLLASVGAASSIAVGLATSYGLTLATFLRAGSVNLYGTPDRVR